jgi:heme A synthase
VFLQIALGAAARYEVFGVAPHIIVAMPLAGMILLASVSLLRRYPDYRPLRSLAMASIAIVLVQVPLGIAVFALRFLPASSSPAFAVAAATHVSLGALLLAASALLALQYRRSVS